MDTKETLLDVAERLARSQGFEAFSYADLSREVGIKKASIHHHFPSKADLALGLMTRYRAGFATALERVEAEHQTAAGRLQAYLDIYDAALDGGSQVCLCVAFSASRDSFDDRVLAELGAFHSFSLAWLTRLFQRAAQDGSLDPVLDPSTEAHATLALVEGAQLMARAVKDPALFRSATRMLATRQGS